LHSVNHTGFTFVWNVAWNIIDESDG
jgi:hypothetical protein